MTQSEKLQKVIEIREKLFNLTLDKISKTLYPLTPPSERIDYLYSFIDKNEM